MMSELVYRCCLWLYPATFRREYGALMVQTFNDMRANNQGGPFGFWIRILRDLLVSALTERFTQDGGLSMLPKQIDNYEIRAIAREGSMSDVFKAVDPATKRDVALKVFNPERAATFNIDRTIWRNNSRRELAMMQALDHPAIPKGYAIVDSDPHAYLVLEWKPGRDLLEIMDEQGAPLAEADLIRWAARLCEVLSYVHGEGLVFRDVKPGNIRVDDDDNLFLVDWGICENYREGDVFAMVGTEGYSPPEQYKGLSDPRSDIFALGASLHHLATGVDPRQKKPFTFHFAPANTLNTALSAGFANVIARAVSPEPADRFQSADEMRAALLACA